MTSLYNIAQKSGLPIETSRYTLRPLNVHDCTEQYVQWLNDDDVARYTGRYKRTFSIDDVKDYVESTNQSNKQLLLGIFTTDQMEHIGNVLLDDYDADNGIAWISNMIGNKDYWANGTAVEVDKFLINFGFNHLNIRKFMIGNLAPHRASTFMSTQMGFEKEALHKKHFAYDGDYVDVIYFGLFPEMFYKKFPEFQKP